MFGTVVVGIGITGRVRIRDLLSPLPSSASEKMSIKGFVSRRTLDNQQGVKQITLEEALDREDIQAAIICTENITHEEYIRKFLDAGKHVCVEYPMSLSVAVARELWDLADRKGKVLHEEHIEILTADYKQLKKEVSGKELLEGTLHFTGGPFQPGFGFASFGGIARLTWLVDLFGELTLTAAEMEEQKENKYMKLTAQFLTKEKRPLTWIEERAPGLGRVKNINFRFDSGTLDHIPNGPQEPVGLFMQDLNWFGEKLLGQVNSEQLQVERRRILHCLELADRIKELCQKPAQNNF
ncbi:biliverdin reductase A [Polyodon spathula]|uniref:biliverdin reductase A n=1 Tax=Polyodon spathula TaxID=7913 RepID=UPI001B7E6644|nr:biliverdin reductase A [Polyodon spathula]XP_041103910.1 biliverdin reductase A [Polyodon spathula]XP_041103911.1 biliverdin reductase A [Polyodon spathula]XP_041103912.1 biliverdin reductase A [Polyodon spathula]